MFEYKLLFQFCGFLSITVGLIGSFGSKNIKQIFAYSSILHNGFILFCLFKLTIFSLVCFFIYLISYNLLLLYFFLLFCLCKQKYYYFIEITDLVFFNSYYFLIFQLIFLFLSFSGIPPFLGFFIKILVLFNLLMLKVNNFFFILLLLIINILNIYIYLRFIIYMQFFLSLYNFSLIKYSLTKKITYCLILYFFFNLIGYLLFVKYIYIYIYYNYLFITICFI